MAKLLKNLLLLVLIIFSTPTRANSTLTQDHDSEKLQSSLEQFLIRTKENEFRDIISFKEKLELELKEEGDQEAKSEILFKLLILSVEMDRVKDLRERNREFLKISQELNQPNNIEISKIFGTYGPLINDRENILELQNLHNLLQEAEQNGNERGVILAHTLIALGEAYVGKFYLAITNLNEALSHMNSTAEDPLLDVLVFWTLGYLHTELSNLSMAVEEYNQAISLAIEHDLPIDVTISILNIGRTILGYGYTDIGEEYFSYYNQFAQSLDDPDLINDSYYNLAVLYYDQKNYEKSLEFSSKVNNKFPEDSWFHANMNQIQAANLANMGHILQAKQALEITNNYFKNNPEIKQARWTQPSAHAQAIIDSFEGNSQKAIFDLINHQSEFTNQLRQFSSEQFGQALQEMNKNLNEIEIDKALSAAQFEKQQIVLFISILFGITVSIGWIILWKSRLDLKKSKLEAEQANIAKSRFLSQMSHELRTPLNSVIGFAETLNSDTFGPLNEKQKEFLGYIHDGGELLLKLINDLLDLSRIESEELELKLKEHSPVEIFKTVLPLVQSLGDKNDIKIHIDETNLNNILLYIDKIRFEQVLINILANALKYGKEGGNVWISFKEKNGQLKIFVKDDGVGIPSSQYENVFKPFNRAGQENSGIEGTGAGLSISKALVKAMKGEIDFESEEGKGSTFWIKFPFSTQPQ